MTADDVLSWFLGVPLRIALIGRVALGLQLFVTAVIRRGINRAVSRRTSTVSRREAVGATGTPEGKLLLMQERYAQRSTAVGHLLRSVVTVAIWTVAVTMILSLLNVDIAPLLASAGIVGIAIGFGAQSLIKDYFSGISLIIEDQFGVGDVVDISGVEGTVEEVALRVTRLRDSNGVVWYLRNGEILRVANLSQGWTMATVTLPVSTSSDLGEVERVVNDMGDALFAEPILGAHLVTAPRYLGVDRVTGDVTMVGVSARTEPGESVSSARAIRAAAKRAFQESGIVMPTLEQVDGA